MQGPDPDQAAKAILPRVGHAALPLRCSTVADTVPAQATSDGLSLERRPLLSVAGLFGAIAVESPCLWRQGAGRRPGTQRLQVQPAPRTPAVERALAAFGAAESFARAAESFQEPYGFYVAASNLGPVVELLASAAETYLEENFSAAEAAYAAPLFVRRGGSELLGELAGCERRTVSCQRVKDEPPQKLTHSVRALEWRAVPVGWTGRSGRCASTFVAQHLRASGAGLISCRAPPRLVACDASDRGRGCKPRDCGKRERFSLPAGTASWKSASGRACVRKRRSAQLEREPARAVGAQEDRATQCGPGAESIERAKRQRRALGARRAAARLSGQLSGGSEL